MPKKPNVVLFLTDDQRFDTIRALGNPEIQTPHLDALVAAGTTFTQAHIPGGTCGAVCMPSRAMLHTGRTLFHLQGEGQEIPDTHTTLAEVFRAAGYHTFGTGKWHNGRAAFARGFTGGDQIFFGGMTDHWNVPAYRFDPTGRYEARQPYVADPSRSNTVHWRPCDHIVAGKHSTDLFRDAALQFLSTRDRAQPFFLSVALLAPHDPRTMPEAFRALYDPEQLTLPANFLPEHPLDTGALHIRDELLAPHPRTPEDIRRHLAEYYAMITHLDAALGALTARLRAAGELDQTVIVVAGDNGLAVGQHGLMGKQNLYDHSVRVPLVFSGPGIPAGRQCPALTYLLDLFPTLCDLSGLSTPPSVEGRSLAACLAGQTDAHRDELYLAYARGLRGIRRGPFKLIEYAAGDTQLFDLDHDPDEMQNLAPARASLVGDLRAALRQLAQTWDDATHPEGAAFWAARPDLRHS